jgi:hypothetical protein
VSTTSAKAAACDPAIANYRAQVADQLRKKEELRRKADQDQQHCDALNFHDDQFDLSNALLAIAVAKLAVTALCGMWPLYCVPCNRTHGHAAL